MSDERGDELSCLDTPLIPNKIRASTNMKELTYTFKKPHMDEEMKAIVISIYSGFSKKMCGAVAPLRLPDHTIGVIGLNLPDCTTEIHQMEQTKPENFEKTHVYYLRMASNFVKHIKQKYPGRQIFLHGSSFGGFFVTSYALLHSKSIEGGNYDLYHTFARNAIYNVFKGKKIEPVNGIISDAGGTNLIEAFFPYKWGSHLKIPAFYHFNFDDDRVRTQSIFRSLINGEKMTLDFSRRAASSLLNDFGSDHEYESLFAVSGGGEASTTKGHNDNSSSDKFVYFINHADELTASPLHQAQQNRLYSIYSAAAGVSRRPSPNPKDFQRFLSNLTNTQKELEQDLKRLPTSASTDADLETRKKLMVERHMDGIETNWESKKTYHDKLMTYATTRGLWKGTIQQLKTRTINEEGKTLVDLIETEKKNKTERQMFLKELIKTGDTFIPEHIAYPYSERLAQFNKAPDGNFKDIPYTLQIMTKVIDYLKKGEVIHKKAIVQAIMSNELITYKGGSTNIAQHENDPIIQLLKILSRIMIDKNIAHVATERIEPSAEYEELQKLMDIDQETFEAWFNQAYIHHKSGFDKLNLSVGLGSVESYLN